jgi:hypothetical protein
MPPTCVNPDQISEVVYFYDDEMTERQIENRIRPLREAIADIQKALPAELPSPQPAPPNLTWLQRNPWAGAVIGAFITAFLGAGLFGFFLPKLIDHAIGDLNSKIDGRIEQKLKDHHFDDLRDSMHQMEGQVKALDDNVKLLLGKSIKQAASLSRPDLKRQLPQLDGILNAARLEKIPVDGSVVRDLSDKLAPLAKQNDQQAWDATLALASYHSVFNMNPFPGSFVKITPGSDVVSKYLIPPPPQERGAIVSTAKVPTVSKDVDARIEPINQNINPQNTVGNAFVQVTGGGIVLDGLRIRNVVFIGVHVVYDGAPLIMENVVFINCTFSIANTTAGQDLIAKSFASSNVTFTAG